MTLANYIAVLSDGYYWKALLNTLLISFWVTVVCFVLGYPLAYFTVFHVPVRVGAPRDLCPASDAAVHQQHRAGLRLDRHPRAARNRQFSSLIAIGLIETPLDLLYSKLASSSGCPTFCCPSWHCQFAACSRPSIAR